MSFLTLLAAVVYLLPIFSFAALRSRKNSSLWLLATDIPLAIAVDLLGVMLLARFMKLELAALVSRGLWLLGLISWLIWLLRKRDFPQRPRELGWRLVTGMLFQCASAVLLSRTLSRHSDIWDRDWHIPLTASLRGQRIPFGNVYEPHVELAYHYAGNVLASTLQTYSGDAMHSALALSLAHDVMFGLLAVVLASTLAAAGVKRVAVQWFVLAAMVLAGPMLLAQVPREGGGYSIGNLFSLSYRPHVSLAFVLIVGFAAALLAGVYRGKNDLRRRVFPTLVATSAALVMTDEITLVLLGLWIGAVWLFDPHSLGETRVRGALKLSVLVAAIGTSIVTFGGSLGLHAARYPMWLIKPRSPGWTHAPEPLSTELGRSWLAQDMFTVFGVCLAALGIAVTARRRESRVVAVSFLVIALGGTFGLTCVDFNHSPIENHRWVTLPLLLAPLLGAFMLAEPAAFGASRRVAGPAAWFVYISCGLGAATTIDWLLGGAGKDLMGTQFLGHHPKYDLNCRKVTGAHWFEPTTPTYIEDRGVYLWAGCHPTFVAGPIEDIDKHHIKTGGAISGRPALQDTLKNMVGPDTPIFVACIAGKSRRDPICRSALTKDVGDCTAAGSDFTLCTVPASRRERLEHP